MSEKNEKLCELCKQHGNAGRREPPHENLVRTGGKEMSAHGKDVSERYYRCRDCGHEWTWEPGNYGMGWL
ncbi:hypothetical protein DEH81_20115 [Pectobacterium zantedeschiae]|nr:hypothetical protein DEH81_20115 [Pectobacterium zantedeschiae]